MYGIVHKFRAALLNYCLFTKCISGHTFHNHVLHIGNGCNSQHLLIDKYAVFVFVCLLAIY